MSGIRKRYKAPWDWLLITLTGGICTMLLILNYFVPNTIPTIITWSIILGCAAFGVYGYSIQDGKLKVLRLGWSKDIPLSNIKSAEVKPLAMMGSVQTWGIGGMFGYIGYFRNSILNNYTAYVTHRDKTVLIEIENEQIVISPDDPEVFVQSLKSVAEGNENLTDSVET